MVTTSSSSDAVAVGTASGDPPQAATSEGERDRGRRSDAGSPPVTHSVEPPDAVVTTLADGDPSLAQPGEQGNRCQRPARATRLHRRAALRSPRNGVA